MARLRLCYHEDQSTETDHQAGPSICPDQVTTDGIDGLDHIIGLRNVEEAVIGQRRNFISSGGQVASPHHPHLAHIVTVDFSQGAVAPAIKRATPHEASRWEQGPVTSHR